MWIVHYAPNVTNTLFVSWHAYESLVFIFLKTFSHVWPLMFMILAEGVKIGSLIYHKACFSCFYCGEELTLNTYRSKNDIFYCEKHDSKFLAPQCSFCRKSISENALIAMDKIWHANHFFCTKCLVPFRAEEDRSTMQYFVYDGKPYCQKDYENLFVDVCKRCDKPILDLKVVKMDSVWHESCFRCIECERPFENYAYYEIEAMPYCEEHFHMKRGTLCYDCHQPITGPALQAMGYRFHTHHFSCKYCQVKAIDTNVFFCLMSTCLSILETLKKVLQV